MKSRYFESAEDVAEEASTLIEYDEPDSRDEAIIEQFYNGQDTMSDSESADRDADNLVNHLFGYDSISTAVSQIDGIYTAGPTIFPLEFPTAPPHLREEWEIKGTKALNDAIKKSRRLRPVWKALANNVTLFGKFVPTWTRRNDWCPEVVRPLVPPNTGTLAADVPYTIIPAHLSVVQLEAIYEMARGMRRTPWNLTNVKALLDALYQRTGSPTPEHIGSAREMPHEKAQEAQESKTGLGRNKARIPVYYAYENNTESGDGISCRIIVRYDEPTSKTMVDNTDRTSAHIVELFYMDSMYDEPSQWMEPMFLDCAIGSTTTWHRTLGLGRLNYNTDVDYEELFNEYTEGTREQLRRTYRVENSADQEMLERWLGEEGRSNILPGGVNIAEQSRNPNFQFAAQTLDRLQMLSRTNARGAISNSGMAEDGDELEVQALERQGRNAAVVSARMNDMYENIAHMGEEILRRMLGSPRGPGATEVRQFHADLEAAGIPIPWLRQRSEGRYENVVVKVNRSPGDGDRVARIMTNRLLLSRLSLFNPEAQQVILRRVVASETADHDFAEMIVPRQEPRSVDQEQRAQNENDSALTLGITGYQIPINSDDLPMVHIPQHFIGLQAIIARSQARGGMDEVEQAAFRTLGAHILEHTRQIQAVPEQQQQANQFGQALQRFARQADGLARQWQQSQQREDMTPLEQEKIIDMRERRGETERSNRALEDHRSLALQEDLRENATTNQQKSIESAAKIDAQDRQGRRQVAISAAQLRAQREAQRQQPGNGSA